MPKWYVFSEIRPSTRSVTSADGRTPGAVPFTDAMTESIVDFVAAEAGMYARWRRVYRNHAIETLFVECVDGKPYSRW